jgi:hypothetical protein
LLPAVLPAVTPSVALPLLSVTANGVAKVGLPAEPSFAKSTVSPATGLPAPSTTLATAVEWPSTGTLAGVKATVLNLAPSSFCWSEPVAPFESVPVTIVFAPVRSRACRR